MAKGGLAKLAKVAKTTAKTGAKATAKAASTVKQGTQKAVKKVDDLIGVVDDKIDPKTGKAISKTRQRISKAGKAVETIAEGITTAQQILPSSSEQQTSTRQVEPAKTTPQTPMEKKATPEVQEAAKNVLAETSEVARPSRDEYMSALNLVNRYEQYGCRVDKKPNPITGKAHF